MRCLISALCLCLLTNTTEAQTKKPSKAEVAEAKRYFNEAQTHYRLQEYRAALEGFQEAYRLSQKAGLLFNVAQCYRQMQQYDEAIQSFEAFIHDDPESAYRAEAEKNITELRALIDAQRALEQPKAPKEPAPKKSKSKAKLAELSLFGLAAGVGAAGAISGGLFFAGLSDFKEAAKTNIDDALLQDDFQTLKTRALLADTLLGVAVLSAGAGVVLHFVSPTPKEASARLLFAPLSGGLQVGLGGNF